MLSLKSDPLTVYLPSVGIVTIADPLLLLFVIALLNEVCYANISPAWLLLKFTARPTPVFRCCCTLACCDRCVAIVESLSRLARLTRGCCPLVRVRRLQKKPQPQPQQHPQQTASHREHPWADLCLFRSEGRVAPSDTWRNTREERE